MNYEDFVTYEQALTLKKLGYREPCLYYYVNWTLLPNDVYAHKINNDPFNRVYSVEALSKVRNVAKEQIVCDAPTLAQVAKWLREVKGVVVIAEPDWDEEIQDLSDFLTGKWYFTVWKDSSRIRCNFDPSKEDEEIWLFDTYESALSAGISKALELLGKEDNE